MVDFQVWLVRMFASVPPIREFMHTAWAWPFVESVHFISLSLLVGTIFLFDLRLLGLARRIPIAALHRLVPFGLLAYGVSLSTGLLFLFTEPDQYIYNPSFHFKILFMAVAGFNALAFYLTSWRRVSAPGGSLDAPPVAKMIAAVSLCMWIGVIIAGRLLTFYRPAPCAPGEAGVLAQCIPEYYETGR